MAASASFSRKIPIEILRDIVSLLPGIDLKRLRLTNSYYSSIAEEWLFREIVVVPHRDSLRQLIKVAMHRDLKKHVHTIVYDTRMPISFEDIIMEYNATHTGLTRQGGSANSVICFFKAHQARFFTTVQRTELELEYLLHAFSRLPALRTVVVTSRTGQSSTATTLLPRFYQRMVDKVDGLQECHFCAAQRATNIARSVLLAAYAAGLRLQRLRLENVNWAQLYDLTELREPSRYLAIVRRSLLTKNFSHMNKLYTIWDDRRRHIADQRFDQDSIVDFLRLVIKAVSAMDATELQSSSEARYPRLNLAANVHRDEDIGHSAHRMAVSPHRLLQEHSMDCHS